MYVVKRILWFFPTVFVVSLLAFALSAWAPKDPVEGLCPELGDGISPEVVQKCIDRYRETFGLNLPLFYLEITSMAAPDTLYRVYPKQVRQTLGRLTHQHGNWPAVNAYYHSLQLLQKTIGTFSPDTATYKELNLFEAKGLVQELQATTANLLILHRKEDIKRYLGKLDSLSKSHAFLKAIRPNIQHIHHQSKELQQSTSTWKTYVPKIIWHGTANQYHRWISNILTKFDFGYSYRNGDRVADKMGRAFLLSFLFPLLSILLAYLIALPMGILAAANPGSWWDRISGAFVWILDALPNFWIMTLLLVWLGHELHWFPVVFDPLTPNIGTYLHQMVLPLVGYTYGALALLSRTMRASLLEVLQQDFIRTARAKGFSWRAVILGHGFRNALIPLITLFVGIFPALVGGSAIIEAVFDIPGMGYEILEATRENDMPMVVTIFTLTGLLTAVGYLVADLLYAWADPRIRLK